MVGRTKNEVWSVGDAEKITFFSDHLLMFRISLYVTYLFEVSDNATMVTFGSSVLWRQIFSLNNRGYLRKWDQTIRAL